MFVCLCQAVTESEVLDAIDAGATDLDALSNQTGVSTGCGCCREHAEALLQSRQSLLSGSAAPDAKAINAYAV